MKGRKNDNKDTSDDATTAASADGDASSYTSGSTYESDSSHSWETENDEYSVYTNEGDDGCTGISDAFEVGVRDIFNLPSKKSSTSEILRDDATSLDEVNGSTGASTNLDKGSNGMKPGTALASVKQVFGCQEVDPSLLEFARTFDLYCNLEWFENPSIPVQKERRKQSRKNRVAHKRIKPATNVSGRHKSPTPKDQEPVHPDGNIQEKQVVNSSLRQKSMPSSHELIDESSVSLNEKKKVKNKTAGIPIKFLPACTLKDGKLQSKRRSSSIQKKKLQTKLLFTMEDDFSSPMLSWGDSNDEFSTGGGSVALLDICSITTADKTEQKYVQGKTGLLIETRDGYTYHFESTRANRDATILLLESMISTLIFNLVMGNASHLAETIIIGNSQKSFDHQILDAITHRLLDLNLKSDMHRKN